ncbi:MAG TPA: tetraacyldisaccharide 4'-kinase [Gemmatimonadaceae bacterium]
MRRIERIWSGNSAGDRLARVALAPVELLFRSIVGIRGELYDRGILTVEKSSLPVISIGNVTVGGTGKTPIAAWMTSRLLKQGRKPAIVLRGYGDDESLVHKKLNPSATVLVFPDRAAGIAAAGKAGADVVVLDDAFQHRRASRDIDIVLVSADMWQSEQRLLPSGPYREPLSAIRRASAVIVTRKTASDEKLADVEAAVRRAAPGMGVARASLRLEDLISWRDPATRFELRVLANKRVLAIAAVGNNEAFFSQVRALGASVTAVAFPDHHNFTNDDIRHLADRATACDYVICTLKDAVKLGPRWPADAKPLWYVSLSVIVESGTEAIDELISHLKSQEAP